ncbi:uncharacterized protein LOC117901842 isoform X2 [Drosophila subobscura]|uniref:uncharacterized protein LOC117901842 isoform X2 n=1 Tax=Drosophila subobscura TaxID=7241 RepID=UPI00155AB59E|nr:uncharacterized protein LOC117901842 isoform X2 [Drosophila subobscura]
MRYYWTFRVIVYILLSRGTSPKTIYFDEKVSVLESANISNEYIANINKALNRGPYFDTSATKNVTSLVGKTGHLNCRIKNLGNKTVSWIRHRDLHLLTVAESTYTSDQRFTSIYNKQTGDWSLQIMFAQIRDSGVYECQVSTTPPVGYTMIFSVVGYKL